MSANKWMSGDWACKCGSHNFASRKECRKCGTSKSADAQGGKMITDWTCSGCNTSNYPSRNTCRNCGEGSGKETYSVTGRRGDWTCPSCDEMNFAYRNKCRSCNEQKEVKDWDCECGASNFEWRKECRDCNKSKA